MAKNPSKEPLSWEEEDRQDRLQFSGCKGRTLAVQACEDPANPATLLESAMQTYQDAMIDEAGRRERAALENVLLRASRN